MEFLSKVFQIYMERWPWFLELLCEQLRISLIAIAVAGSIGLLLGILIAEHRRFAEPIIAVCNLFYTIPAIALIALLIPLVGIGEKNAILAIVLYGLMPMVRNTYTGITTIDEAEEFGRNRPHPLALYLFTEDKAVKERFLRRVAFGGGCINDTIIHLATSRMGFGGVGNSGMGSYHGKKSFDTFSHRKSIVDKSTWMDLPMRYAPYSDLGNKLIRMFMK